jgi:hypothetical protein
MLSAGGDALSGDAGIPGIGADITGGGATTWTGTVHTTVLAIEHEPALLSMLTISIPGSGMSRTSTRA